MQNGRLELKQNQRMLQRISPHNVALGRILEMNGHEFEDEVRNQLNDNPALEVSGPAVEETETFKESPEELQRADYGDPDEVPDNIRSNRHDPNRPDFDPTAVAADDYAGLADTLEERLNADYDLSDRQQIIARHIIGNIDSNGYMRRSVGAIADEVAINEGIEVTDDEVERVLELVKSLEPAGIAASDLQESLLLQLKRRNGESASIAYRIISDYFEEFSKMHFDRIQTAMGLSRKEMEDALEIIRKLNPRPASALDTGKSMDRSLHLTPDFILDIDRDNGRFSISMASETPALAVEKSFTVDSEKIAGGNDRRRQQALAFIRDRRADAENFIRLTELRNRTLMEVASAIVRHQFTFFLTGNRSDVVPMILKDISAATGLDLSVISRAVSGKYILAPTGIYSLKSFFNERPNEDTEASSQQVLEALRNILDTEDKRKPLSDRLLTAELASRGYEIARRTVANYREKLGYPTARLRKKY